MFFMLCVIFWAHFNFRPTFTVPNVVSLAVALGQPRQAMAFNSAAAAGAQRFSTSNPRVRRVVVLLAALLIAAIWAAVVLQIFHERRDALREDQLRTTNLAQSHERQVASAMHEFDQLLLFLRKEFVRQGKPKDLNHDLAELKVNRQYAGIISFIDADGKTIASTTPDVRNNYADRDYFKSHASDATDQLLIGQPIKGRITGKWLISLTRRLYRPDGSFGGVVFLALDPGFFAQDYEKTDMGPHAALALIGMDGVTRVRRNNGKISYGEDISKSQVFKEIPKALHGHYVAPAASDGQLRSVSYGVLQDYPLLVIVGSSVNDLMDSLKEREVIYVSSGAMGSLLIAALCALLLTMLTTHGKSMELIESNEARLRSIVDVSPIPMAVNNNRNEISYLNAAFARTYGYEMKDIPVLDDWMAAAYPDTAYRQEVLDSWMKELARVEETGTPFTPVEVTVRCKDGGLKTVVASATFFQPSTEGENLVVLYDITARKASEDALQNSLSEKTGLLNEVHHRVKNNLQVVSSLLRLESGRSKQAESKAVLDDMQGRIRSMSLLHESLYRSGVFAEVELGKYLKELATQTFRTMRDGLGEVTLALDLSTVRVSLDQATPCAFLVNELLSNCLKHGFPGDRAGQVRLSLKALPGAAEKWQLQVSDTGVGLPEDFEARCKESLGMQLAHDLSQQIGGPLVIGPATLFSVTFSATKAEATA
jgi:PAS domain S-box-containing protein